MRAYEELRDGGVGIEDMSLDEFLVWLRGQREHMAWQTEFYVWLNALMRRVLGDNARLYSPE